MASAGHSKRAVSRAGQHLAARLTEVRRGERQTIVDEDDRSDVDAREVVEWWRSAHVGPMLRVHEVVSTFAPPLDAFGQELRAVSFRPKRFDSTIEKLTREPGKLADMVDIGGVRAVVNAQDDADALHRKLARELDVRRIRDWARNPRPTGYRAVHLHVREQGRMIEIQLRTFGQDAWANVVEDESRLSGSNYKTGNGEPSVLEYFRVTADFLGVIELAESHPDIARRWAQAYERARPHLRTPRLRGLSA